MCHLLNVEPAPSNGSLDRISVVLNRVSKSGMVPPSSSFMLTVLILTGILVPLALLLLVFVSGVNVFSVVWRQVRASRNQTSNFKNGYRPVNTKDDSRGQKADDVLLGVKNDTNLSTQLLEQQEDPKLLADSTGFPGDWGASSENEVWYITRLDLLGLCFKDCGCFYWMRLKVYWPFIFTLPCTRLIGKILKYI